MLEIDRLRVELEKELRSSGKSSLYDVFALTPSCSDEDIRAAVAQVRANSHDGKSMPPEQMYAIEALAQTESRERYDRQLFARISANARHTKEVIHDNSVQRPTTKKDAAIKPWHAATLLLVMAVGAYGAFNSSRLDAIKQSFSVSAAGTAKQKTAAARQCAHAISIYSPKDKESAVKRLEDKGIVVGSSNLLDAVEMRNAADVSDLLIAGVDPNKPTNDGGDLPIGRLFLRGKSSRDDLEIARLLVNHGANVNSNPPALINAVSSGDLAAVNYLISQCADLNQRVTYGQVPAVTKADLGPTPLLLAVSTESIDMVRLLLMSGANPRQPGVGTYPMCFASTRSLDYVMLLQEHGATLSDSDATTWSPLMCALNFKKIDVAKYLIEKGANVNFTSTDRETAMSLAKKHQQLDIVDLLRAKGANE